MTFTVNGKEIGKVSVEIGEDAVLKYTAPAGYSVATSTDYTYADGKLTVKNVTENKTIAVNLTENARTVTISGDAGNVEVTGNTDLDATKEVTITLEAKDGYTITGVESNLGSVSGTSRQRLDCKGSCRL